MHKIALHSSMHIYCALEKEVQSCTNLAHILRIGERGTILRKSCVQSCANLAHILRIGEITTILRKSCAYIAHWRNNYNLAQILHIYCALEKEVQSCANLAYNLVQILRIYCALEKEVQSCTNLVHILCIEEISTILRKSFAYIAH